MDSHDHNKEIDWHLDILPHASKKALDYLAGQSWLKRSKWYLAGGTALALQMGHRASVDLDFFLPEMTFVQSKLISHFPKKQWQTSKLSYGTVFGSCMGAKTSFIAYPFFLPKQKTLHWYGSVRVLDAQDIALMKIIAISQRGTKRDFVDLFWYCQNREPLLQIIERLPIQYPSVKHNYHHILKSLAYFEDAEGDPMPRIFFKATWRQIKKFFQREVVKVTRKFLGLR